MDDSFSLIRQDRDAWPAIRGYVYQVDQTILSWLRLSPGEALELECGEDIDKLAPLLCPGGVDVQRTLEQVKCLDRAITLRSASTREALCSYADHTRENPSLALRFRYLTNAMAGEETPRGPLLYVPGVALWEELRQGRIVGPKQRTASESIAAFLRTLEPPRPTFADAWSQVLQMTENSDHMAALISNFEWATGAAGPENIAVQTEDLILSAGHVSSRNQVRPVHDRLFVFILRLLATPASKLRRRLDHELLRSCLAGGPPTAGERELIRSVEGLRDFIAESIEGLRTFVESGFLNLQMEVADVKQVLTSHVSAVSLKPVFSTADIQNLFSAASSDLLTWPQETQGKWVDREELRKIEQTILNRSDSCSVLLGSPGSGKSALLSRLGTRLQSTGTVLLAIKAEKLPRDIRTLDDLDDFLQLKIPLADTISQLAADGIVVLLVDQLDAIASLMDQHTNRLNVLLQLVHRVRGRVNVHVVVSCREFDFQYDSRFASLNADAIRLSDPHFTSLKFLLDDAGVNVSDWPIAMINMLRNLQHLNLFLAHFVNDPDQPIFENYQAMLEATYRKLVLVGDRTTCAECCERIAAEMTELEEMQIGRSIFDEQYPQEVDRLVAAGILRLEGRRIAFRHQTLFDYVRTRVFATGVKSLSEYVLARQNAVFVRSMVWAGLTALRSFSLSRYRTEVGQLWNAPELRKHVRLLLIAFLGQVAAPDPVEVQWLMSALEGAFRGKVLSVTVGSRTWFSKLQSRLPALMTSSEQVTKWQVSVLLRAALEFDRALVLQLVSRHWESAEYHQLALQVFYDLRNWDEEVTALVEKILQKQAVASYVVTHMAQHAAKMQSGYGPRLISAALSRAIKDAIQEMRTAGGSQDPIDRQKQEGIALYISTQALSKPIRNLLEGHDWHGIDDIAKSEPAAFVGGVLPLLIEAMSMLASPGNPRVAQYQSISLIELDEDLGKHHGHILHAVKLGIQAWGEQDPDSFLVFAEKLESTPLLVVHQLLAYGFEHVARTRPHAVAQYLIRDARRFAVGNYSDRHHETRLLVKAVSEHMASQSLEALLNAVLQFEMYPADPDDDAQTRWQRRRWNREHRLRLLRAFPSEKLPPEVRKQRDEEETALSGVKDYDTRVQGGLIASPISPEQMGKAANEQIINAFQELRERPRDWASPLRGGLPQAAQAFGVFAKQNPSRAMSVIEKLQPSTDELPAAHGVFNLSTLDKIDPTVLVDLIERLAARGFETQEFREMSGWALQRLAVRMHGLPDQTCEMLRSWLDPHRDTTRDRSEDAQSTDVSETVESWLDTDEGDHVSTAVTEGPPPKAIDVSKGPHSLLWGLGGGGALPHGNYPALSALESGYLLRKTPAVDEWLDLLTEHFARGERSVVWSALVEHFNVLGAATDRERALLFLRNLFCLFPDLIASDRGIRFLGRAIRWLPEEFLKLCLQLVEGSSWPWRQQAVGEIVTLRLVVATLDEYCVSWVEDVLAMPASQSPDLARVGIAFAAINLWAEPSYRRAAHRLLMRVVEGFDSYLARAVMDVFRVAGPMPPDAETRALLEFVAAHPELTRAAGPSLIPERMRELLADSFDPALIAEVTKALLAAVGPQVGDFRSEWHADSGELIEISMTLQRFPETRSAGLDIFESLLDFGAYEMDRVLRDLDRRPV